MYSRPSASTMRLPCARTKAIAGSTLRLRETTPPAMTSFPRRKSSSDAARRGAAAALLPVPDAAIGIESPLQEFLLKGMFAHLGLVDLDAQAGPRRGTHGAGLRIHPEAFLHDVLAPGNVRMDRFADDVG